VCGELPTEGESQELWTEIPRDDGAGMTKGEKVSVRLPCKYGYGLKTGLIISRALDKKYVILLDVPVEVPALGKSLDIVAVRREKLERIK
jgi:hypothetical protein